MTGSCRQWTTTLAVVVCALALLSGVCGAYTPGDPEYRAFWVDCIHPGLLTQTQVDKLLGVPGDPNSIGDIRAANCNTIVAEVRRSGQVCYDSALNEPWLTSGNFDALTAVLNAAHDTTGGKKRIEVHAWIVTFMTGGGTIWDAHRDVNNPDNYWPTLTSSGATADSAWDPGHPKVQKYIVDVMMDLVTNFDVDGVHYDYIRFTGGAQGYNPTSIARYNARYGLTGQPSSTDDLFDQWRRDQITGIVRQVYARIQSVKPHVLQSGSFVTWNPSPTASTRAAFQATRPYGNRSDGVFSDWDAWMQEGIMDVGIPMNYYDDSALPADYDRWLNFIKDRGFNRQMINGPGLYKNYLSNNDVINQILATREPSPSGNYAAGFCGFSYWAPYVITKPTGYGTWDVFKPELVSQVTPTWADIPDRPWKSSPTKGHISGTVTYASNGAWVDGATVSITPDPRPVPYNVPMFCDGTGFYAFIDLTPGVYTVTASKTGYADAVRMVTVAIGSVTGNMYVTDLQLGGSTELIISNVQSSAITNGGATITWDTNLAATSQVEYGLTNLYGSSTTLDSGLVTSHSQAIVGLAPSTPYHYRVRSSIGADVKYSGDYTYTTLGPPTISNVQSTGITTTSATITWNTNVPADSKVNYGTTPSYGSSTTLNPALVTSHSVVVSGLMESTLYHFQCVSANGYGTAYSSDYTFTTPAPSTEVVIDNTDSGWADTGNSSWSTGSNALVPKIGTNYLYAHGDGSTTESSSTRKCKWTPFLTTDGYYDVYVYYQMGTNRNTMAPYTVHYNGGAVTSVQNQWRDTANQGDWFLVAADKPFLAGSAGYVEVTTLSTDTNYVSADAAKWVLKSPPDTTPPTISIGAPSGTLTKSGPISYTISYADNVGVSAITLANGNVTLNKTGSANGTAVVSGGGIATRTVTVSSITGTGTLGISIAAGTASDIPGNLAPAAGPSATFSVDNTAPAINSVGVSPAMAAGGDAVHAVVDATDNVAVTSVTANGTALALSGASTWAGDILALGPLGVHAVTIVASDAAGNSATNATATYKTAKIVGASSGAAWQSMMNSAGGIWLFKFWGKVAEIDDDYFTLSDGSSAVPITVHAPGYKAKVVAGDYASARGILNIDGGARWIESELGLITKY